MDYKFNNFNKFSITIQHLFLLWVGHQRRVPKGNGYHYKEHRLVGLSRSLLSWFQWKPIGLCKAAPFLLQYVFTFIKSNSYICYI